MRLKAWIRSFFGFSKTETNGFLILLPLLLIVLFSEPFYRAYLMDRGAGFMEEAHSLDSLIATLKWEEEKTNSQTRTTSKKITFKQFDPNVISEKEFVSLGLSPYLAARIDRYRKKGGLFKSKSDLKKIYGMDSVWFRNVEPWIVIASVTASHPNEEKRKDYKSLTIEVVDINEADSVQFRAIQGIGSVLARRIINYRSKLGGFHSIRQVREIYGLDTAVIKKLETQFKIGEDFITEKINLNTTVIEDLVAHPYVKRKEAQAIITYRMQHGKFNSVDQLNELKILDPVWIEKIRPYLRVE